MELSCLPVSFFDEINSGHMSIPQWGALARQAGLTNIDLSAMFLHSHVPVWFDQVRAGLDREGVAVKMITTYPDFSHPNALQRERELAYLQCDIAAASALGAPYVRITAGQTHAETARDAGICTVVENFKRAAEFAERMNVTLVYENHAKPGAWHTVDFSYATDVFLEIVEKTQDTPIRVNFDTANPVAFADQDEPMKILPRVAHRLGTVHIADTSTKGSLHHTVIGTGLVRFAEIFAYLKSVGYDGLFSIEEGSGTGLDGVRRAVDFVKTSWEAVV